MNPASPARNSLVRRSVHALKWAYVGVAARVVMQLASQIVLARLLGPGAYGVVTAAVLIILITGIVAEQGVSPAIVQMAQVQARDLRLAFTRVLFVTLTIAVGIFLLSGPFARLFGNEQIGPVLRWMTLALVFQALGAVSLGLLRRNLDFKSIQVAQMVSYFVGFFVVGIASAVLGFGEWSLVAAWVTQTFTASAMQFRRAPHSLIPAFGRTSEPLFGYGGRTVVASLANWGIENTDNFMVGRAFGTTTLGAYAIAYNLVRTPVNHIVFSIQQVFQPFIARAIDDQVMVSKAYMTLIWSVALVTMPAFLSLGALAPTAIDALYGRAWDEAIPLLLPLALAMPLQALQAVGGPVLWGSGQVGREIRVSITIIAILLAILSITSTISVVAMAWGVWLTYLIRSVWITSKASEIVGVRLSSALSMLAAGLALGILTATALYAIDAGLARAGLPALARLLISISAGAVIAPVLAVTIGRRIVPAPIRDVLVAALDRVPERIRPAIRSRFDLAAPAAAAAPADASRKPASPKTGRS